MHVCSDPYPNLVISLNKLIWNALETGLFKQMLLQNIFDDIIKEPL